MIALPVYSADVFAELNVVRYSGEDNVTGFVKREDSLTIEVDASLEDDSNITSDQVYIETTPFSNPLCNSPGCTQLNGNFKCSCISPFLEWDNSFAFDVKLFSDSDQEKDSVPIDIKVDDLAPEITVTDVAKSGDNRIAVEFTVKDSAYLEGNYDFCSGVKRIEFWDGSTKYSEEVNKDDPGNCIVDDLKILEPIPDSGIIILKAYDWLENEAAASSTGLAIDISSPQIDTNTFRIQSPEGAVIDEFLGSGTYNFIIEIIDESSIDSDRSLIDLSDFGCSSRLPAVSCQRLYGDVHECIWTDTILAQGAFSASAEITAVDIFGNSNTETTPARPYGIDSVDPVVSSISTGYEYEGRSYISIRPVNISVLFEESGSGFNKGNAYLSLRELSSDLYPTSIAADECVEISDSFWECTWFNITTTKTTGTPEIYLVTSDDAGNSARASKLIHVDIIPPEPEEDINIIAIGAERKDYLAISDSLEITAYAEEESGVTAYADICSIKAMPDCDKLEASCVKEERWKCQWIINSISGPFEDAEINFTFYDTAMNPSETITEEVDVLAVETNITDYWAAKVVGKQPPRLDRQTVNIFPQRMWFDVELKGVKDASTLNIELGDCVGADAVYIDDQFLMNNEAGSTHPYIILELKTFDVSGLDELNLTCPLEITTLTPENTISQPETENVNLSVGFFNQPLGEASSSLENEIDDAKNWVYDLYGTVHDLNEFVKMAKDICRILAGLKDIGELLTHLRQIFVLPVDAASGGQAAGATHSVVTASGRIGAATDAAYTGFEFFCALVTCNVDPEKAKNSDNQFINIMGSWQTATDKWMLNQNLWPEESQKIFNKFKNDLPPSTFLNSRDSIVGGALTACIPGILFGLEKASQIQCQYISCIQNSPTTGTTVDLCKKIKSYGYCKYVVGEIFQISPWTGFIDMLINSIKQAYADPLYILDVASYIICMKFEQPSAGHHIAYHFCELLRTVDLYKSIESNIESFAAADDISAYGGYDYCAEVEDFEEE